VPGALRLAWSRADGRDVLRIEGATRELPVFAGDLVDDRGGTRVPPILTNRLEPMPGTYTTDASGVSFAPRFPFLRGRTYAVVVDDGESLTITLPRPRAETLTRVDTIHPDGPLVPRNLLRCYVTFSAPMSEGQAATRVRVVDVATGDDLEGALLPMEPELWDPQRRRLTVLFDPARIKRGLAPHREAGYPLTEGGAVELVVDAGMRDAAGQPLAAEARRRYDVGADVRARVDPHAWAIAPASAGTRAPLTVTFDRAIDQALAAHCLAVVRADGTPVRGSGAARADDRWSFLPDAPWAGVDHALVVDPILEDVCGNSVARVFDRELADPTHAPGPTTPVAIRFSPR